MSITQLAAQIPASSSDLTMIHGPNIHLSPDISPSESGGGGQALSTPFRSPAVTGITTDTAPMSTRASTTSLPPQPSTYTITAATTAAAPTHTPAISHGLPLSKLAAAIFVPMAFLAILIPIIVFWCLNHRRKLQEQKRASQRNSHSREPMMTKLREPMIERPISYKGAAPARPLRKPADRRSRHQTLQQPSAAQTRDSLGLFNFELSPTTPRTPQNSRTPESEASPHFRFSVARALEMRRSQPSIIQPHARTSDTPATINPTATEPVSRGWNRGSASSIYDPPPPYVSPRPSESVATRSHFAPLSRIGTRNLRDRSPQRTAAQVHAGEEADRSTYASSDAIQAPDIYGRVRTRSDSTSLEWPSSPQPQRIVARKPVPYRAAQVTSHSTSPQNDSHLNEPSGAYLPYRVSDISGFSIDTSRWGGDEPSRQNSTVSSIRSTVSPMDSDTSTIQPHHLV